jgi:hypothetical protein
MTIRWQQTSDGNWEGSSGELVVATVTKDGDAGQTWLWIITALKRPKGRRKPAGHRTTVLDARGAADVYWGRWLAAIALRPDLPLLAKQSLKVERDSAKKPVPRRASAKARKSSSR